MIKKILGFSVIGLFMIALLPLALAAQGPENASSQQATNEVALMKTPYGANVRLLELNASLQRAIVHGEEVLDVLGDNATLTLQTALADLESLQQQIQLPDATSDASQLAQEFVAIKEQARNATMNFRQEARALVNESQAQEIRTQAQNRFNNESKEQRQRIHQSRRAFNAQQVQNVFGQAGMNVSQLARQAQQGNASVQEIREQLHQKINNLSVNQRVETAQRFRENRMQGDVFGQEARQGSQDVGERIRQQVREHREELGLGMNQQNGGANQNTSATTGGKGASQNPVN